MFEFLGTIFNALLYQPMLNILILLYLVIKNFGVAVIALTILVKILIHPLNKKAIESQKKITELQPKIKELQENYKDDQQRMAIELMSLYKLHKFNPFAGILLLFIQLPIIIALYWVFLNGFSMDKIQPFLYSFVNLSEAINPLFLSIDLSKASIPLAFLAAAIQYYQVKTSATTMTAKKKEDGVKKDGSDMDIAEMMQKQMTFMVPIITLVVLWTLPSAVGLYWMVSSIVTVIEQKIVMKK
ncbi:MAG: YidC/Oxa1 family membrane protein insertase [Candidatus Pacebacteria bacterium]|nr:YidC/Oxa1 family membrane protein insertase [Candidatus Paceibacterota bacterium]